MTVLGPKTLAPFLAAAVLGAGAAPVDPWAPLRRPLQLQPLAAGAPCPVTAAHPLDRGRLSGVGAGPVYPMPTPFADDDRLPGLLGSKTIWAWPPNLRTHGLRVLVRGMRLDRPGPLRFQLGPRWDGAPPTDELHLDTRLTVGSFVASRWGTTVTMLLVRDPGCYGLQLDSARGTTTIVVDATRR